jgi:hypothetical protein
MRQSKINNSAFKKASGGEYIRNVLLVEALNGTHKGPTPEQILQIYNRE